jgi:hypothetical protein
MAYGSRGKKPIEWASKINHTHIINDKYMQDYIKNCNLPKDALDIKIDQTLLYNLKEIQNNPIKNIIAIDGGYTEVIVKKNFPSSKMAFFQFGALFFSIEDLEKLEEKPFISPEDMSKFKDLYRIKFSIPIKNITYANENTLTNSIRKTIYEFFMQDRDGYNFMETLYWLVFQQYNSNSNVISYKLSSHPITNEKNISLNKNDIDKKFIFPHKDGDIYLTDIFRLHEAIDNELGASGILGYITSLFEQIIMAHFIKYIYEYQPNKLKEFLFIKDGPLAFFGQTANIHKLFRNMINFISEKYTLSVAGLEKSGSFVEHANEIIKNSNIIKQNQYLLLNNKHIYTYILAGDPDNNEPYARTSYYSSKIIFHSKNGYVYVVTLPTKSADIILKPKKEDFKNIDIILHNIEKLKCDMYDDSLVPIALVNQLVSIANHPSTMLLNKFSKENL